MKKVKITFLGLFACLAIYQVTLNKEFVNDVSLLSYQLMALADECEAQTGTSVTCYANVSSDFFSSRSYHRCNAQVTCYCTKGKNPQGKDTCTHQ